MTAPDDASKALIARYDREADAYRELWAPILRRAALKLLPRMESAAVERVLDVGTGVGALLPDLCHAFPGARVIGVDRSQGMLAFIPEQFECAVMDAAELGFRTESMDRVLMIFMLFHLPDPAAALREARRLLRDGGQVGAITWGSDLDSRATQTWIDCLDAFGAAPTDPATASRHDRVDTTDKMEAYLAEAGFGSIECWVDDLVHSVDSEHLLRLRTSLGSSKPRFDSLAPDARSACLAEARRRMASMPPEAFVARATVVYSVAGP